MKHFFKLFKSFINDVTELPYFHIRLIWLQKIEKRISYI